MEDYKDKQSRNAARIAALETGAAKSRDQLRVLVQKSKLDDQLINDFR